jgi:hypothetical protein
MHRYAPPAEGAHVGWFRGFLALKSLLVGLAVLALWGRSYFAADLVRKGSATQYIQLGSASGSTLITFGHDGQPTRLRGSWQYVRSEAPKQMLAEAGLGDSVWNRIGFGFKREIVTTPTRGMVVTLIAPHWLIFLLAMPSAIRWMIRKSRAATATQSEEDRFAMHVCPYCGQTFARVPVQCPVCRNPLANGTPG